MAFVLLLSSLALIFPSYADVVATSSNYNRTASNAVESGYGPGQGIATLDSIRTFAGTFSARAVDESDFVNCVRYDVTISGDDYICLFQVLTSPV